MPGSIDEGKSAVRSFAENANGTSKPPNYRTGDFLDPKARAKNTGVEYAQGLVCLLYTSPSPRDTILSRMPSSA